MHVASLELSRELYELSGWDDRRAIQYYWHGDDLDHVTVVDAEQHEPECAVYPAYDLGYLLRKLPESTVVSKSGTGYGAWLAGVTDL